MQSWSRTESAHLCDTTACLISHLDFSPGECAEGMVTPCGASHIRLEIASIWISAHSGITGVSVFAHVFLGTWCGDKKTHCRVSLDHTVLNT